MKAKKPTAAQAKVLRNMLAGLPVDHHCRTRSDHGGLSNTLVSLHRAGWVRNGAVTDSGRAAVGSSNAEAGHE